MHVFFLVILLLFRQTSIALIYNNNKMSCLNRLKCIVHIMITKQKNKPIELWKMTPFEDDEKNEIVRHFTGMWADFFPRRNSQKQRVHLMGLSKTRQ